MEFNKFLKRITILTTLFVILGFGGCFSQGDNNEITSSDEENNGNLNNNQEQIDNDVIGDENLENSENIEFENNYETCSSLGGFECSSTEMCNGEWLDAYDTFTCCSVMCETIDEDSLYEIDSFELPEDNEEEGFGEVIEE